MPQHQPTVTTPGAHIVPMDDLPTRLRRYRLRHGLLLAALLLSVVGLPAVLYLELTGGRIRQQGIAFMLLLWSPLLCTVWLGCAAAVLLVASSQLGRRSRAVAAQRAEHLAPFQWFEVWADAPSGARPAPWRPRSSRFFLQLFVHPDPAVPRHLTRGTDLVVTGGCTADDLRAVTAHLDVLLHRALLLGLGDPTVRAVIRPVPRNALPGPNRRWQYEVHDPAVAHAFLSSDLASGWPAPALVARYRELLATDAAAR